MKPSNSIGVENAEWLAGEMHSWPTGNTARFRDFLGHLGAGQNAAVAGFCALAHLDFDHLDLRVGRLFLELFRIKAAIVGAAAKIAAAQLPNQIAAAFAVVAGNAALAGVVVEAARLGTLVQCQGWRCRTVTQSSWRRC
jgi:hypothetical protein